MNRKQYGLTLVELMIAIALGMLVVAAVASLYVNASRNFREDDQYARMQENGRYAMHFLKQDLMMADFWGFNLSPADISVPAGVDSEVCGARLYRHVADTEYGMELGGCASPTVKDSLLIKRTASVSRIEIEAELDAKGIGACATNGQLELEKDKVYLWNGGKDSNVEVAASTGCITPPGNTTIWEYQTSRYYVDDNHTLKREVYAYANPSSATVESLVNGVERVVYLWNIGDSETTAPDFSKVLSVKACLLMRSGSEISGYTNDKTYDLCGVDLGSFNDGYQRRVFEQTIELRNTARLTEFM